MNNLGTDNLVKSAVDVIEAAQSIGSALKDGFQITDAAALFSVVPRIRNVVSNGRQAISELVDLDASESAFVAEEVARLTGNPATGILAKVNTGLELLARTHQEFVDGLDLFGDWKEFVNNLA